MEKFEKLHGHLEMVLLFAKIKAFYFHLLSTVQVTVRPKTNKNMCVHGHISKKSRIGQH
jgi:hypothetical protein